MAETWDTSKLLKMSGAFFKSRILITAAELDIFGKLADSPRSVKELCSDYSWDPRGAEILLDVLTAMELLVKTDDGKYGMEESAARLLVDGVPGSVLPMIRHRGRQWGTWSNLTEVVKTGENPAAIEFSTRSGEDLEDFIAAMHVAGRDLARKVAESFDLSGFKRMLDVGGGSGVYIMAFLERAPQMTGILFDLPKVTKVAREKLMEEGYIDRVEIVVGDYRSDPFPSGQDLVLLSAVIHINNREGNRELYRKSYESLNPGGTVLVRDHVMDASRTSPLEGAIFAVNMLAATTDGGTYTFDEIKEDLESAGFENVSLAREGAGMDKVVSAVKPL